MKWINIEDKLPDNHQKVHVIYDGQSDGKNGEILTMEYCVLKGFFNHCLDLPNFNARWIIYWIDYESIPIPETKILN